MTTQSEKQAAADAKERREDLAAELKADEAAERREDLAAERKAEMAPHGNPVMGAAAPAPSPPPLATVAINPVPAAPIAPAMLKPVVRIAHFAAGEVEAIDASLRDSARDASVHMLNTALARANHNRYPAAHLPPEAFTSKP
jgi:hypothetical protein